MTGSRWATLALVLFLVGGLLAANVGRDPSSEAALAASAQADASETDQATADRDTADAADPVLVEAPPDLGPAMELVNLDGWINSDGAGLASAADSGQVRIIQFWTFGCYNCKNTLPFLQDIYAEWQPKGLEIVGVHAPEFDREAVPANIEAAAADLGVTWPVALDTDKRNFRSWQGSRRFWPRTYVVDQNGQIRFDHIGEGSYDELEATVAYLIENGA